MKRLILPAWVQLITGAGAFLAFTIQASLASTGERTTCSLVRWDYSDRVKAVVACNGVKDPVETSAPLVLKGFIERPSVPQDLYYASGFYVDTLGVVTED